jgi:hypothetical protein
MIGMNKTNLLIDTAIFAAFVVAMEPRFSGLPVHEWLSLALAATIVIHLLLHWKWITGIAARFFQKLWHASRLKFVVDTLLFVAFIAVMLSGILISRSALPALGLQIGQVSRSWRTLHSLSANLSILLVGLHFALNWDWVVGTVKRLVVSPLARLVQPKQAVQENLTVQPVPVRVSNDEN